METEIIGCTSAGFEEKDGKYTAHETLQKHVYFVNDMSIERTKRKFIERFVRKLPIEQLEAAFNFKMEDVELEGQYTEGSKFSCELSLKELLS
jgi:thymidylate synthase